MTIRIAAVSLVILGACVVPPPTGAPEGEATRGAPATPLNDGYELNTATFDDGWTSTAQAEWVLAQRGDQRAYLYYGLPYRASDFTGTGVRERDYYWDQIVARDFAIRTKATPGANDIGMKAEYVEGWATERATGQQRFLMMYVGITPGAASVIVTSSPDEATARAWYPRSYDPFASELPRLARYNRFPIGAGDLVGTWSDTDSSMAQWYNATTGEYAGATIAARSAVWRFAADGTYTSTHNGATGALGAMNTFQQEYAGTYTVAPWEVTATNRWEGATDTYEAHFEIVRGGRLLTLASRRAGGYILVRTER